MTIPDIQNKGCYYMSGKNKLYQQPSSQSQFLAIIMKSTLAFFVLTWIILNSASAAIVVSTSFQNNGTGSLSHTYTVSSTDLLNGLTASASTGFFVQESAGGVPVLTDGSFTSPILGTSLFAASSYATGGESGGTSVTYTIPVPVSIASINVYGGWRDSGRDQQSYSVFYAVASAPSTFILMQTVNFNPAVANGSPVATKSTISNDATGILAADVKNIRFVFNTTENGYSGYSEIDVIAVPEPSALLLGCAGLLCVSFRRCR